MNKQPQALIDRLESIFQQQPHLRPNSQMHDYQLTYPPAIQIEQPQHAGAPNEVDYQKYALGNFRNAAYYFHFGFCQYRCRYCHHYEIKANQDEAVMEEYVQAMIEEMRRFRSRAPHLNSLIYFLGGGTPTMLSPALLEIFLKALHKTFGPPSVMSTVEAKPVTVTAEKLALLRRYGFRRINLGVQTLDPSLYAYHHYGEDLKVALDAIHLARQSGFDYINIDILTGLQGQTPESWRQTLSAMDDLIKLKAIDSVFIYPYHDDPRSKSFQSPHLLPGNEEVFTSDAEARNFFRKRNWIELGTRFYRAPRHRYREYYEVIKRRANPAYGALLYHGFGNSAFSIGDRATYLNHRDMQTYMQQVRSAGTGISHWVTLDDAQRATRDVIFDLLYAPFVRVRQIKNKYGQHTMQGHMQHFEQWTHMGLGHWNPLLGIWRLNDLGKLIHQQLLRQLYLQQDEGEFRRVMELRFASGRQYRGY